MSLFFKSFPFVSSVSSGVKNWLMSSSHLFLGLPTALHALAPMLRAWIPSCCFQCPSYSSGRIAILIANLHFIFLCASIQHGMLAVRIFSWASLVLRLMYSIHSSSSISTVSMSSSESLKKDTLLSWSHPVSVLFSSSESAACFADFFLLPSILCRFLIHGRHFVSCSSSCIFS